jgi:hypothetical protein
MIASPLGAVTSKAFVSREGDSRRRQPGMLANVTVTPVMGGQTLIGRSWIFGVSRALTSFGMLSIVTSGTNSWPI